MTDTKPPSAGAFAFADWVLEFLVGYKTWAIEENRLALAQRIDAFAERRAAEARRAAIEECAARHDTWAAKAGPRAVVWQSEGKDHQAAFELTEKSAHERAASDFRRALADRPAAGNGEP